MKYNYTNIFTIKSIEIEINRLGNTKKIFTVPNTYNAIANIAFSNQTELEEVIIPRSINWIGLDAFHNCINLKKISILNRDCEIKTYFSNTPYSTIFKNIFKFIEKKYNDDHYNNLNSNQVRDRYFIQFLKDINEDKNNIIKYITVGAISFEDISFLLGNDYSGLKDGINYGI